MNDELDGYYELLGVAPGADGRELKEAYRDLAKEVLNGAKARQHA